MLPTIILFLALVFLIWGILSIIINYAKTLIEKKSIDLTTAMWLLLSSAALFSLLFYLTH